MTAEASAAADGRSSLGEVSIVVAPAPDRVGAVGAAGWGGLGEAVGEGGVAPSTVGAEGTEVAAGIRRITPEAAVCPVFGRLARERVCWTAGATERDAVELARTAWPFLAADREDAIDRRSTVVRRPRGECRTAVLTVPPCKVPTELRRCTTSGKGVVSVLTCSPAP